MDEGWREGPRVTGGQRKRESQWAAWLLRLTKPPSPFAPFPSDNNPQSEAAWGRRTQAQRRKGTRSRRGQSLRISAASESPLAHALAPTDLEPHYL